MIDNTDREQWRERVRSRRSSLTGAGVAIAALLIFAVLNAGLAWRTAIRFRIGEGGRAEISRLLSGHSRHLGDIYTGAEVYFIEKVFASVLDLGLAGLLLVVLVIMSAEYRRQQRLWSHIQELESRARDAEATSG